MSERRGLDRYAFVARWLPGTLLVLPISVTLVLGIPTFATATGKILALVLALGMPVVVGQLVRDAGRRAQETLYAEWGGAPTTHLLRGRLSRDDSVGERLRRQLRVVIGDYPPVPEAEDVQATTDDVYEAIIGILRNRTREQAIFPTVFDELVHYGFWRNLYALRRYGLVLAGLAAAAAGVVATLAGIDVIGGTLLNWAFATAFDVFAVGSWAALRAARVRTAGDRYAEALLGAVETITPTTS